MNVIDRWKKLYAHLLQACILCLWTVSGFAQAPSTQVPDSVVLTDLRFFVAKDAGQQFLTALQAPEENYAARDQGLNLALQQARRGQDPAAEALIETELALSCLRQGQTGAAFDWVNRCLALDSVLPPLSPLRQRMHLNVAGIYTHIEAHRLALQEYKKALQIDESRASEATARRYRHACNIAISFQSLGQMDSAFTYYQRAIVIAQALGEPLWISSGHNNLGMAYQSIGRYNDAIAHFQQARTILVLSDQTARDFARSVHDNLGHVCMDLGRYEDAYTEFQSNLARIQDPHDFPSRIKAHLGMAEALIALGNLGNAGQEINQVQAWLPTCTIGQQLEYEPRLLHLRIQLAQASRDWHQVAVLQEIEMQVQDSITRQMQHIKLGTLENLLLDKTATFKAAMELSQSRNTALESRTRIRNLLYAAGLLVILLVFAVAAIVLRRRAEREKAGQVQERYRRELLELSLKNQQLENDQLTHALEMKQRDITDFALVHSQRRKVFVEVLDSLKHLKRAPHHEQALQELINSFKGKMDAEGNLSMETQNVDLVNNAYYDKLRRAYPALSPAELELCSMIRLGYSAKDIASMRSIAPASVRIGKTRLKKKLDLGPEQDLTDFLKTF